MEILATFKFEISMKKSPLYERIGGKQVIDETVKTFFNNV